MLFFGSMGAFNLLEKKQPTAYVGDEVPRDMIESAYLENASSSTIGTGEPTDGDSVFLPADSTPEQAVPTLASIDPATVVVNSTPDVDIPQPGEMVEEEVVEPRWIYAAKIGLDAPIIPATSTVVEVEEDGQTYKLVQWEAPDEKAVGWHSDTAPLGKPGNTVLNGHHNVHGKVFGQLVYLQEGDLIQVYGSDGNWYAYVVVKKMVLPEEGVSLQKRMENAAWLLPSDDERLTLLTCWPEQTNTHRLIIVASPVQVREVTPTAGSASPTSSILSPSQTP